MDGRIKKFNIEMLYDLTIMGDKDFCIKWDCSRQMPIRLRKKHKIESFNNQHGTKKHKIEDGIEYKWCQKGHWEVVSEFYKCPSRYDGLRCFCKIHSRKEALHQYYTNNGKEKCKAWTKTENGKQSRRNTWRKRTAIKNQSLVSWTRDDEDRIYKIFDGRCAYCGKEVSFDKIEFDHCIPLKNGGKTEPSNMIPSCSSCNHGKDGKFTQNALEWLKKRYGKDRGVVIYTFIMDKLLSLCVV